MRRLVALAVLVAACRHASEEKRPEPVAESTQARAERIAAWDAGVTAYFRQAQPDLRACYERELRRVEEEAVLGAYRGGEPVPPLAGSMVVVVPIEEDGAVRTPRLEQDSMQNSNVRRCLLDEVARWRFPKPPTGEPVELEMPLKFELMGGE